MRSPSKTPQNWASKLLQLIGWGWYRPGVQPQDLFRAGGVGGPLGRITITAQRQAKPSLREQTRFLSSSASLFTEKRSILPIKRNFCSTEHFNMSAYKSLSVLCTTRAEIFRWCGWARRKECWGEGGWAGIKCFSLQYFIPLMRINTRLSCLQSYWSKAP